MKSECIRYLKKMVEPRLELSVGLANIIFEVIDLDMDGKIDKFEIEYFLYVMTIVQDKLTFKTAQTWLTDEHEIILE